MSGELRVIGHGYDSRRASHTSNLSHNEGLEDQGP